MNKFYLSKNAAKEQQFFLMTEFFGVKNGFESVHSPFCNPGVAFVLKC